MSGEFPACLIRKARMKIHEAGAPAVKKKREATFP